MIFTLDNTKLLLLWIDFKRNTIRNYETLFGAENELCMPFVFKMAKETFYYYYWGIIMFIIL